MMNSSAHIQTTQASRIAKRLLNHWKHKFDVAENASQYQIMMPAATILLTPQTHELVVEIQVKDAETGERMWIDTDDRRWRMLYKNLWDENRLKLQHLLMKAGVDKVSIDVSEDDYIKALIGLFKQRGKS